MSTDEARIKARYPKRSTADYLLFGIAGLAVLVAIVLVLVTGLRQSNPDATAMVRGFEVVSPSELTAEIVLQRKNPGDEVECSLYAQAVSYEKVGETVLKIPAGQDTLTTLNVSLKTVKEANAVTIEACKVTG